MTCKSDHSAAESKGVALLLLIALIYTSSIISFFLKSESIQNAVIFTWGAYILYFGLSNYGDISKWLPFRALEAPYVVSFSFLREAGVIFLLIIYSLLSALSLYVLVTPSVVIRMFELDDLLGELSREVVTNLSIIFMFQAWLTLGTGLLRRSIRKKRLSTR